MIDTVSMLKIQIRVKSYACKSLAQLSLEKNILYKF